VVAHQAVGQDIGVKARQCIGKHVELAQAVGVVPIDRLETVAARGDVINGAGELDAQWSGHGRGGYMRDLTPYRPIARPPIAPYRPARNDAAEHGTAMTATNASIDGVFGVASLHRQGESCVQWSARLVLGPTPPGVAPTCFRESRTARHLLPAKRQKGAPSLERQTYNPR